MPAAPQSLVTSDDESPMVLGPSAGQRVSRLFRRYPKLCGTGFGFLVGAVLYASPLGTRLAQASFGGVDDSFGAKFWENPQNDFIATDVQGNEVAAKRGVPGSSASEDADAWFAARQNAELAAELDIEAAQGGRPLQWVPLGNNQVVDDEGSPAQGTAHIRGSAEECQTACDANLDCHSFTLCGKDCSLKSKPLIGTEPAHWNRHCSSYFKTADTYRPSVKSLALPSDAPTLTYYVYRAQGPPSGEGDYPLANVNAATIGGVLWYLHDEVIRDCWFAGQAGQRRFGITRIRRFKITHKATTPLYKKSMNFGLKCSFDSGECSGPHLDHVEGRGTGWHSMAEWDRYGYFVGCNALGVWPHNERTFQSARRYPDAVWYSFPGPCPTMNFRGATKDCKLRLPGGLCSYPDGRGNCTYSVEEAGEIDIDALVGIVPKWKSRADFCRHGGFEGNGATKAWGHNLRFWDNIWDPRLNAKRTQAAIEMFNNKYPTMPRHEDLLPPKCDIDVGAFFRRGD